MGFKLAALGRFWLFAYVVRADVLHFFLTAVPAHQGYRKIELLITGLTHSLVHL